MKSSGIATEFSLLINGSRQPGLDYFWSFRYIARLLAEENPRIKCASDTDSTLQPMWAAMH